MPHRSLSIIKNNYCIYFLRLRTVIKNEALVEMILQDLYVGVAIKQARYTLSATWKAVILELFHIPVIVVQKETTSIWGKKNDDI